VIKAYVKDWKERPPQSGGHTYYDVTFDPTNDLVKSLDTKELAEIISREFEYMDVEVPSGKCKNFRVEQRAPKQFVICCDYPAAAKIT
jgi:hypothetical protein